MTSGLDGTCGRFDPVMELRQYTLLPGRRDALIGLMESRFLEPQAEVGARVHALFRDLDDPDRFVWLRGFASMEARLDALTRFYGGLAWRAHREAANETMRDSDNVLLLRPYGAIPAPADDGGAHALTLFGMRGADVDAFAALVDTVGRRMLADAGAMAAAVFVTESATNTFPALPVRTDEAVVVVLARYPHVDAMDAALSWLGVWAPLRAAAPDALLPAFMRKPEILRLAPSLRSAWR